MLVRSCHGCSGGVKMSHMNWKVFLGDPMTVHSQKKVQKMSLVCNLFKMCIFVWCILGPWIHIISLVYTLVPWKSTVPLTDFVLFFCVYKCIVVYWYCHKPIIHCDTKVCLFLQQMSLQCTLLKSHAFCMIRLRAARYIVSASISRCVHPQ